MPSRTFLRSHRFWLIIVAGCIVLAAFNSFAVYLNSRVAGRTNWNDVIFTATLWLVFAALTWIPYALARRFPLSRARIGRTMTAHLTGAFVLSLGWTSAGVLLAMPLARRPAQVPFARLYVSALITNLPYACFCISLSSDAFMRSRIIGKCVSVRHSKSDCRRNWLNLGLVRCGCN